MQNPDDLPPGTFYVPPPPDDPFPVRARNFTRRNIGLIRAVEFGLAVTFALAALGLGGDMFLVIPALIVAGVFSFVGLLASNLRARYVALWVIVIALGLIGEGIILDRHFRKSPLEPTLGPDVTIKLVYPDYPALVLVNNSDKLAREIKWSVGVWNLDDPRTYVSQNPAPDGHDPLPIPVSIFDFIRPHSTGGPQILFAGSNARPFLKEGQHLFGSISVICPDCIRGHTYLVYVEIGKGGWFTEEVSIANGELIIPQRFTKDLVQQYYQTAQSQIPEDRRIPITAH